MNQNGSTMPGSKSYIGLRDIVYAVMNSDEIGALASYGAIKRLAPAKTAAVNPSSTNTPENADDGVIDVITSNGPITVSFGTSGIDDEVLAELLGAEYDGEGGTEWGKDRHPPFVAIGFKSIKADGTYGYMWLLKGKFQEPNREHASKEDTVTPQTSTLEGTFIQRQSDDLQKHTLNTAKASEDKVNNYFKSVYKSEESSETPGDGDAPEDAPEV